MTKRKDTKSPYPIAAQDVFAFITEVDRGHLDELCGGLSEQVCAIARVFLQSYTEQVLGDRRLGGAHYKNELEVLNLVKGLYEVVTDGMLQFLDDPVLSVPDTELLRHGMLQINSTITNKGVLMLTISTLPLSTARNLRKNKKIVVSCGHYLRS